MRTAQSSEEGTVWAAPILPCLLEKRDLSETGSSYSVCVPPVVVPLHGSASGLRVADVGWRGGGGGVTDLMRLVGPGQSLQFSLYHESLVGWRSHCRCVRV